MILRQSKTETTHNSLVFENKIALDALDGSKKERKKERKEGRKEGRKEERKKRKNHLIGHMSSKFYRR